MLGIWNGYLERIYENFMLNQSNSTSALSISCFSSIQPLRAFVSMHMQ